MNLGNPNDNSFDQVNDGEHTKSLAAKFKINLVAVIGGAVIGNFIAKFAGIGIDASYGRVVTGDPWNWSLPNFIYAVFIGLCVGFVAGIIAKQNGWLIGLIAYLLPVVFVIALILMQ